MHLYSFHSFFMKYNCVIHNCSVTFFACDMISWLYVTQEVNCIILMSVWVVPWILGWFLIFYGHGQGDDEILWSDIFVNLSEDLLRIISKIRLGSSEVWWAAPCLPLSLLGTRETRLQPPHLKSCRVLGHSGQWDLSRRDLRSSRAETLRCPWPVLQAVHPRLRTGWCPGPGVLKGLQKNLLLPLRHPPTLLHGHGVWCNR